MHPPPARKAGEGLSWRERLASLRNVQPLLGIVWRTSPPLVLASTLLRLARALIPPAMLWVSKLILDAIVARISRGSGTLQNIWHLVALKLALAVASDVLGAPIPSATACSVTASPTGSASASEQGSHHDLVSLGGRYAELFELQAAGYR